MAYIDIDEQGLLVQVPEDLQFMITKRALGSISFHMENATARINYLEDIVAERDEEIAILRGLIEDARDISRMDYESD